jgi:hypothetical protein
VFSPSDFAFLWDECRRCFYNKVALGLRRPSSPFPKVFGIIDRAMKDFYLGKRAEALAPGAPAGAIGSPDRWVKSAPILVPGSARPLILRGRLDAMVASDNGTAGVVEFKTAMPNDRHIPRYARQLHSYAWSLEHPVRGQSTEVSAMALLCFSPSTFGATGATAALLGELRWLDVPRDDRSFERFLGEVVAVLEAPDPPPPAMGCPWCSCQSRPVVLDLDAVPPFSTL